MELSRRNVLWLAENDTRRNLETVFKETARDNKGMRLRGYEALASG